MQPIYLHKTRELNMTMNKPLNATNMTDPARVLTLTGPNMKIVIPL